MEPENAASPFTRKDLLIGLILFLLGFVIYTVTLAPDVLWGDSGEFQVISATGGLAHASGYPIYLALGKLFTLLPFKTIAYRVDLLSAMMGALASAGVYFLTKALGARRAFAVIAGLLFLLNPLFWWQSIIAEVYAITAAFFVTFLTCAVAWQKTRNPRWLLWGGLVGGLCLGLHHTVVLTLPAMILYLLVSKAKGRDWSRAGLGALIGVVIALIGYFGMASLDTKTSSINSIRRSATAFGMKPEDFNSTWTQVRFLIVATQWHSDIFKLDQDKATRNADWYQREDVGDFGWPAAILGVVGFIGVVASRKRWREAVLLGISWAILFYFILIFNPIDLEVDFIPSFLILAALSGIGLQCIQELIFRKELSGAGLRYGTAIAALLVVFGGSYKILQGSIQAVQDGAPTFLTEIRRVYPFPVDHPSKPHDYAHAIVDSVEPNALIVTDWHYIYPFYYVGLFDDDKAGIEVIEATPYGTNGEMTDSMRDYIRESVTVRPVYTTMIPRSLYLEYYFQPTLSYYHLYRLRPH